MKKMMTKCPLNLGLIYFVGLLAIRRVELFGHLFFYCSLEVKVLRLKLLAGRWVLITAEKARKGNITILTDVT